MKPPNIFNDRIFLHLAKRVNKALKDFEMISDGDRIAVAVSGGPDSLSLLYLLNLLRQRIRERYEIAAIHVIGDARGPQIPRHLPLERWLIESGIEYVMEPLMVGDDEEFPMSCHRCSRNRRKTLFTVAHRLGCNKVALGHHTDDIIETTLMNLFYHGRLEGLEPRRSFFNGLLEIIRPLYYVPKKKLQRLAQLVNFPTPPPECPSAIVSQRYTITQILKELEKDFGGVRRNIFNASLKNMNKGGEIYG